VLGKGGGEVFSSGEIGFRGQEEKKQEKVWENDSRHCYGGLALPSDRERGGISSKETK